MGFPILEQSLLGPSLSRLADGLSAGARVLEGERARQARQARLIGRLGDVHAQFLTALIEHRPDLGGLAAYRELSDLTRDLGRVLDDWLVLVEDADRQAREAAGLEAK